MTELEAFIDAVQASTKYGSITPELTRKLGAEELKKHPRLKEAVSDEEQAASGGGCVPERAAELRRMAGTAAAAETPEERRSICRTLMQTHASTRERLGILHEFTAWRQRNRPRAFSD